MEIKIYKQPYDKTEFYGIMGQFFAEPKYQRELPYMFNSDEMIWFLLYDNEELIGFSSIQCTKSKYMIRNSHIEEENRKRGYYNKLTDAMLKYIENELPEKKPIELAVKEDWLKKFWQKKGFKQIRQSKNYMFLKKEVPQDA